MSSPDLTDREREAVAAVLRTPNLSMGAQIERFERAVAEYTGARHAIGVHSGTAGLHLCIHAAGVRDGDLVVTTPFSFVASTNVILFERGVPVFVDVDPETGNIDPVRLAETLDDLAAGGEAARGRLPRRGADRPGPVRAVLPVDVFGQPADLDPIVAAARRAEAAVIEDSCEALGARYKGRQAGTIGDTGVFAFYPNKQITTGEGGMIVTDDDAAAERMRSLRNQGRAPGDTWLQHTRLGYNYRLDEMSAALGAVQMDRLDELLDKRARVAGWYLERLEEIPRVAPYRIDPHTTRMSWFVFVVKFDVGLDRDALSKRLHAAGVPNRPYFLPIHLQPYMAERFGYREGDFPITEDLGRRGLALPFSGVMEEGEVDYVCRALAAATQK
ncbi:MAG TPA: DegT/DnrJ/EryC1/StrS family aminotransferase [Anaerolineales bacterium]|nr:DegT/DnrJ/EryC1/StrS family aminotransferase [Anaerolineales bacterium]